MITKQCAELKHNQTLLQLITPLPQTVQRGHTSGGHRGCIERGTWLCSDVLGLSGDQEAASGTYNVSSTRCLVMWSWEAIWCRGKTTGKGIRTTLPSSAANHRSHRGYADNKVGVELFLEEIPKGFSSS